MWKFLVKIWSADISAVIIISLKIIPIITCSQFFVVSAVKRFKNEKKNEKRQFVLCDVR